MQFVVDLFIFYWTKVDSWRLEFKLSIDWDTLSSVLDIGHGDLDLYSDVG